MTQKELRQFQVELDWHLASAKENRIITWVEAKKKEWQNEAYERGKKDLKELFSKEDGYVGYIAKSTQEKLDELEVS